MRIELSGSLVRPAPLVLTFQSDDDFDRDSYIDAGYTDFEVICIGAGGGPGGGIDTAASGTYIRNRGGAGGGGGIHRVSGILSDLPSTCAIVVGEGGIVGSDHASNPALTTNGGDGGYSSFGTDICRASGGKGGVRAQSNSNEVSTEADGGDGGLGGTITAGGGGTGGTAGTPSPDGLSGVGGTDGSDGYWDGTIGGGGGGGAGGVAEYTNFTLISGTAGGRGAYNPSNLIAYSPGALPSLDPETFSQQVLPGRGGGAKASLLTGDPEIFGRGGYGDASLTELPGAGPGAPGIVVIRLTAV